MWRKWWIRWGVGLLVTAVALWLSFRKVDAASILHSLSQVRWAWVVVAVLSQFVVIYLGGWRWQFLLRPKGKVSLPRIFKLQIVAQYANIVAPARLGEAVRAVMVSKDDKLPMGYSFGTVVIERIFDLFILTLMWLILPLVVFVEHGAARIGSAVLFCVFLAVFIFFVVNKPHLFWNLAQKLSWFIPKKYSENFSEFAKSGMESFQLFVRWRDVGLILGFSMLLFAGQALGAFFMFFAFDLKLTFMAALVVIMLIKIGYIPPSAPGKIGVYEYAVVVALAVFGISRDAALGYAIVLHVVSFLPKILLGQFFVMKG